MVLLLLLLHRWWAGRVLLLLLFVLLRLLLMPLLLWLLLSLLLRPPLLLLHPRRHGWHGLLRLRRCCGCCGCGAAALLRTAVQLRLLREQARQQATWQVRRAGCGCGCCCGALLRLRRLRLMRVGRPARGCCSCDTGPRLESCTMGCPVGACWLPYGGLRAIFMSALQMYCCRPTVWALDGANIQLQVAVPTFI